MSTYAILNTDRRKKCQFNRNHYTSNTGESTFVGSEPAHSARRGDIRVYTGHRRCCWTGQCDSIDIWHWNRNCRYGGSLARRWYHYTGKGWSCLLKVNDKIYMFKDDKLININGSIFRSMFTMSIDQGRKLFVYRFENLFTPKSYNLTFPFIKAWYDFNF